MNQPNGDTGAGWRATAAAIFRAATEHGVPARSLRLAVVVGTVLNLINQGDALAAGAGLNWFKIGLTYVMPYLVSTYGAVSVRMELRRARTARP